MHAVVMDSLEDYLSGTLKPADWQAVDTHLSTCQACREEIHGIEDVSQLFVSLKSEEILEPSPGFCAGVMRRVEEQATVPSLAGMFSLDFAFGRRLVFASLLTLAVLGSYLVSRETDYPVGQSPEAILAQEDSPAFSSGPAQDNMLVTLTAYEQR